MSKPSIAELLRASGHTVFTADLVVRAVDTLYGYIGAGLDERDWDAILASDDPLAASEEGLRSMYEDVAFLKRNADHLSDNYSAAQIEHTYRGISDRIGSTHSAEWAAGTAYASVAEFDDDGVESQARRDFEQRQKNEDNKDQNNNDQENEADNGGDGGNDGGKDGRDDGGNDGGDNNGVLQITAANATLSTTAADLEGATGPATAGDDVIETNFMFLRDITLIDAGDGADTLRMTTGGGALNLENVSNVETLDLTAGTTASTVTNMANSFTQIDLSDQGDTVTPPTRNVFIEGGKGDDTVIYETFADFLNPAGDLDLLNDDIRGGGGTDTIQINGRMDGDDPLSFNRAGGFERLVQDYDGADSNRLDIDNAKDLEAIDLSNTAGDSIVDLSDVNSAITVTTGAGADTLIGGAGAETLEAGGGNDTLTGGAGADTLTGGTGANTYIFGVGDSQGADDGDGNEDELTDFDATADTLIFTGGVTGTVDLTAAINITKAGELVFGGSDAEFEADFSNITTERDISGRIRLGTDATAFGGGVADGQSITAGDFDDNIVGGAGDDVIDGGAGADDIEGGAGNDTLTGGEGADTLAGGDGNDDINGQAGNDTLTGGAGIDTLTGGGGDDTLTGGAGDDTLTGGAGVDTFNVDAGSDTITDLGIDRDNLIVSAGATVIGTVLENWAPLPDTENDDGTATLELGNGVDIDLDFVTVGVASEDGFTIDASGNAEGSDITGSGGDDTILGSQAGDKIDGREGSNTISYANAAGGVTVDLGDSNNNTGSDADGDTLTNIQHIVGSSSADDLTGDDAANNIAAGAGADTINGGAGDDTLTGGDGDDTFNVTAGSDTITDLGSGVDDLVVASGATATATVVSDWTADADSENDNGTVTLNVEDDVETVNLSSVNVKDGKDPKGLKNGFTVDATGSTANLTITGSRGNDTITGGDGADRIEGGIRGDVMSGGAGADIFVVDQKNGTTHSDINDPDATNDYTVSVDDDHPQIDLVTDFDFAKDELRFQGGLDVANLQDGKNLSSGGEDFVSPGDAITVTRTMAFSGSYLGTDSGAGNVEGNLFSIQDDGAGDDILVATYRLFEFEGKVRFDVTPVLDPIILLGVADGYNAASITDAP